MSDTNFYTFSKALVEYFHKRHTRIVDEITYAVTDRCDPEAYAAAFDALVELTEVDKLKETSEYLFHEAHMIPAETLNIALYAIAMNFDKNEIGQFWTRLLDLMDIDDDRPIESFSKDDLTEIHHKIFMIDKNKLSNRQRNACIDLDLLIEDYLGRFETYTYLGL